MGKVKKKTDTGNTKKKSPLKRILSFVSTFLTVAVFVFVFGIAVFSVYNRVQEKNGNNPLFGYSFYIVVTGSMVPEILEGELVVVRQTDFEDLEIGQVLTFKQGDKVITHKIIAIDGAKQEITTQGLANDLPDKPVKYQDAYGIVVYHSQVLGAALVFASSNYGFFLLIMLPLVVFVTIESVSLSKKLKKYKAEKESERNAAMKQLEFDKEALLKEIEMLKMGAAKDTEETEQTDQAKAQEGLPIEAAGKIERQVTEIIETEMQQDDVTVVPHSETEESIEDTVTEEQPAEVSVTEEKHSDDNVTEEQPEETIVTEEQSAEAIVTEEQSEEIVITEEQPEDTIISEEQSEEKIVTEEQQ